MSALIFLVLLKFTTTSLMHHHVYTRAEQTLDLFVCIFAQLYKYSNIKGAQIYSEWFFLH